MHALKVQINDGPEVVAGKESLTVLTATVTLVGKLGDLSKIAAHREQVLIDFNLGGVESGEEGGAMVHTRWINSPVSLRVGDVLRIELVDVGAASSASHTYEPELYEGEEKEIYEESKRLYFELRSKYEPDA